MSALMKVLLITLCMNICLSLAGVSIGGYDSLSKFITISNESVTPTNDFSLGENTTIPTNPNDANSGVSTSDNTFIDTIKLVFGFLLLVIVSLFFPLYWGFVLAFPIWLNLLLAVLTITNITAVVLVLRGTGS